MHVDRYLDAMKQRDQQIRPERESTAKTIRPTLRELDREIAAARTKPRLPLFEENRAPEVAELERVRSMIARQLDVAELSLIGPG